MAFVVFEGLDGSGKSTLMEALLTELKARKIDFVQTREPGGTQLGDEIREMLLRVKGDFPFPRTEILLYEAIRAQHVQQVIQPARKKGLWVICDRFDASTVAFQGGGRGFSKEHVHWLNEFAKDGCQPDLYVLLDLPVEEAQKRIGNREKDRLELENLEFHQNVCRNYQNIVEQNPEQWLKLEASLSTEDLLQQLLAELEKRQWLA